GRPRSAVQLTGGGFILTGPDWASVERQIPAIKQRIAFYGSTRTYLPVFAPHGWEGAGAPLPPPPVTHRRARMAAASPAGIAAGVVEAFVVAARYDELPAKLRERYGGIADSIGLELPAEINSERVRSLLDEIRTIPTFGETVVADGARQT